MPEERWTLYYDGLCPMCRGSVRFLDRLGLLRDVLVEDGNATEDLTAEQKERLRTAILLGEAGSGQLLGGASAVFELARIHGRIGALRWLVARWPFSRLADLLYCFVALNRRILSPPATGGMACACDPPYRPPYRAALLVVLVSGAVGGALAYGAAVAAGRGAQTPLESAVRFAGGLVAGWLLGLGSASLVAPRRWRELFWQTLVVVALASLVLLPFAVAHALGAWLAWSDFVRVIVNGGALGALGGLALRSIRRRADRLAWPDRIPWWWIVLFIAPVAFTFLVSGSR